MKPHQRKNKAGRPEKPITSEDPNYVFFFMPNDQPNGIFCQWRMNTFTVPLTSLTWLKTTHPKHSTVAIPSTSEEGTLDFNCSEQFMMHAKALFFGDDASAHIIMASKDPKEQKEQGKKVAEWNDLLWSEVRERVVFEGNWWKFTANRAFRELLLGTGEKMLVEAAGRDRVWGIGFTAKHALSVPETSWGLNLLGKTLVRVREAIRVRLREGEEMGRSDWDLPEAVEEEDIVQELGVVGQP